MTKKGLQKKVLEVQEMWSLELDSFEEKLSVSDLEGFKKDILFKAIKIRRDRNKNITDAIVEMESITDMDEFDR